MRSTRNAAETTASIILLEQERRPGQHLVSHLCKTKYSIPNFWDVECLRKCFPALAMRVQWTGTLNSAGIEPVVTAHKLRMLQMLSSSLIMPFAQAVTALYASLLLMNISFIDLFFFCVVYNDTSEAADPVALELYLFLASSGGTPMKSFINFWYQIDRYPEWQVILSCDPRRVFPCLG